MKNDMEVSVNIFQNELFSIVDGLVWKDKYTADKCEVGVDRKIVDQFLAIHKNLLDFDSIYRFDKEALVACGLSGDILSNALENKNAIPPEVRDLATSAQIAIYLKKDNKTGRYVNYEEKNNYYRRLYGLPDLSDTDVIYNTKHEDISMTTPIHELPLSDRYTLEERGYIDELKQLYPKKKYLNHLASKMIDPYVARSAERFDILWLNTGNSVLLGSAFRDCYDNCRQTVIRTYYRPDMGKSNAMYEGFIGMCILFMTINLMFYKYLETDITRDFFDVESLKYVYDSYGVPFYPSIPISLHKKIVKRINILLSYKGSTRVFYELFDLFGYGSMDIYEFYLLKTHKMNSDGTPHFTFKEDGTWEEEVDQEVKFGQVRLYDNPPLELSDTKNHLDYYSQTADDPYWVSDADLMNKLLTDRYNYQETKYLGIRTVFDMMAIVYESAYFFKLILDNREALDKTLIFFNPTNKFYNIFDLTIYIGAVICKKHGYEGVISGNLPIVSKMLGYNFKSDINAIKEDCINDPILQKDSELMSLLRRMNVNSLASINSTFSSIMNFRQFLFNRMCESKTEEAYVAYHNLYKSLMTSEVIEDVYKKEDGEVAETFTDLLQDRSLELFIRMNSEGFDPGEELDNLFILYEKSFSALEYIKYCDGIDMGPLLEQLFLLLKFFKSSEAELTGYNIVYTISRAEANFIKFIGEIMGEEHNTELPSDKLEWLMDMMGKIYHCTIINEKFIHLKDDNAHLYDKIVFTDWLEYLKDELVSCIHTTIDKIGSVEFIDFVTRVTESKLLYSQLPMQDCLHMFAEDKIYPTVYYSIDDSVLKMVSLLHMITESHNFNDKIELKLIVQSCIDEYMTALGTGKTCIEFYSEISAIEEDDFDSRNLRLVDDCIEYEFEGLYHSNIGFATALFEIIESMNELNTRWYLDSRIDLSIENRAINDTSALFYDTLHLVYEKKLPDE